MYRKHYLIAFLLLFVGNTGSAQTFLNDYSDIYDTVWSNIPNAATCSPGHGAVIAASAGGSPGWGFYHYNYITHIGNKGDSVWVKRNVLDTTFIIRTATMGDDTIHFEGLVSSVIRLNGNGNYLVAGDNFSGRGYFIKQLDSNGNHVSSHVVFDTTYASTAQRDIKLVAAEGNNFYLLYNTDSVFWVPVGSGGYDSVMERNNIQKMDNSYNVFWSRLIRSGWNFSFGGSGSMGLDIKGAVLTSDSGLAYARLYDTTTCLEKLKPNGVLDWSRDLSPYFGGQTTFLNFFATHDSCIVGSVYSNPTPLTYTSHMVKFDHAGALTDSVSYPSDTAIGYNGVELSTGKYLFVSGVLPEFFTYDTHLNYLASMPYPFVENNLFGNCPMFANPYGGAFCTFDGSAPGSVTNWHIVAVNFDSLFGCYPSYVTGHVFQDNNYDCISNTGDLHIGGAVVQAHDATTGDDFYGFAGSTGNYVCNVPFGNYAISHASAGYDVNECGAYSHSISTPVTLPNNDFSDTLTRGIRDLQLWISSTCLVPGDTTLIMCGAYNHGSTTADSPVVIILDPNTTFASSNPAPIRISGDTLTFALNLLSDSVAGFEIYAQVATTVTAGTTLHFSATSSFPNNVVPSNDSAVYNRMVVSSYDPNYIAVNQPLYFHRNNTVIYTVNFQNTGTYKARNIVVLDTLDSKVDPATFRFINSSHANPTISWMTGNRVYFMFNNINLPDSTTNEAGSHGYLTYAINTKSSAVIGDTIHNTSYIFFDYNTPVVTNTTTNILGTPSVVNHVAATLKSDDIAVYPNPSSNGRITIHTPASTDGWLITVSDITGRALSQGAYHTSVIDVMIDRAAGIYFVTIANQATQARVTKKVVITCE